MRSKTFAGICLVLAATAVHAAGATNTVRELSLQDCVQLALLHNWDIRIERLNPRIAQFELNAANGYYDPTFTAEAQHIRLTDPGGYDPRDLSTIRVADAENYQVNAGFRGFLPSGMSYQIQGDYVRVFGARDGMSFDEYRVGADFSVQQPLLRNFWIDQPRTTIRVNKANLRITELGVNYVVMDTIDRVQQVYYELIFTRENLKVQERLLAVRQQFDENTRLKVQAGALPALEQRLAQAQLAQAQADLILGRHAIELAENELKTLLGEDFRRNAGVSLVPTEALLATAEVLDLQESWQRGMAQRPDLAQLRLDLEKSDLNLRLHRNQLFPYLDLVAGYGQRGGSTFTADQIPPLPPASAGDAFNQIADGTYPHDQIGVIFTLPLSRATERANYHASKEQKEQAALRLKQREELVLRQIDDAIKTARAELERVRATRESAEFAQAALEAEQQKLAVGQSTFFVVLRLQSDLAAAQSAAIRAKADLNKAVSHLHFAEGSLLERNRITVELKAEGSVPEK